MKDKLNLTDVEIPTFFKSLAKFEKAGGQIGVYAITSTERAMWAGYVKGLYKTDRSENTYPLGSLEWDKWEEGYMLGLDN